MKVLGILGSHKKDGITAQYLAATAKGIPDADSYELLYLADYDIKPDMGQENPVLDKLETKLQESDFWIIAAPTYWGALSGIMKNFFDCMRPRMVRMTKKADTLPAQFKDKHYLSITTCFISSFENFFTGITDDTFKTIDRALTGAGLIKVTEIVGTGTWGQEEADPQKLALCQRWGAKITAKKKKDDNTLKRYLELFCMIAAMALVTMGLQQLIFGVFATGKFWATYVSFVLIFFILLASLLHFFTFLRHRRR
ncbi:flavodoxin family protein [Loigolactobacillus backii]|uniref:NADPH-dependent FMN reductase n=1 Tax=Loigolactobacillus backii TaxID=375175 RepID=A0A192H2A4_9LACO|nr:flavodoxin family protein [Loigolactobacillus backii]ANK62076.1 NADPH-dependent FMN reductase [Loigolactobacillus backii]ANK68730.1 NADPH-dependent FMN reductase [Loigolactobacillus backii]MDA5386734.1 flavodoxin family protein [Loigolactobacillus backii]MDA5389259.1 flavodoxin family protein [Loigolactobacillus backii]